MADRAPQYVIRALEEAVRRLDALCDNRNESCTVGYTCSKPDRITNGLTGRDIGETVKDRVRPYVETWVTPDVRKALAWAKGEKAGD